MAYGFSTTTGYNRKSSILRRCEKDDATRARLKYNPWYHEAERQDGARVWVDGREMIMMSSNDYLGFSSHPAVLAAGRHALDQWGSSTTGARLANGSRRYHSELEEALAAFLGKEDCMVLSAGYLACMSAVSAFAEKGDLILVDRNVHSSLWTGITLSGAKVERFAHNNAAHLAEILETEDPAFPKMVVMEGVYSMEGHIAPLRDIHAASCAHNCFYVLDDAHGVGVLGNGGQGTAAFFEMTAEVDVICGSLSKSLASTGGFIAGARAVIEYLRSHSKQCIFSAAISPAQAMCARAALDLTQREPEHRERLWDNTRYYKRLLDDLGLDTWGSQTPAVPIIIGNRERTYRVWKSLFEAGVFTVIAITPAVPPGKDLLRTAVSARHSREDLEKVAEALARSLKRG